MLCTSQIEAEEFPETSLKYEVVAVPTFILFKVSHVWMWKHNLSIGCDLFSAQAGQLVDRVDGAHVPELAKKTATHSQTMAPASAQAQKEVQSVVYNNIQCLPIDKVAIN